MFEYVGDRNLGCRSGYHCTAIREVEQVRQRLESIINPYCINWSAEKGFPLLIVNQLCTAEIINV